MGTTLDSDQYRKILRPIRLWYAKRGRRLPWRGISDPYRILVSEIMLQQTQVQRVLLLYPVFIRQFPTLRALARARRSDVVRAWKGLGYNNRAVRLHELSKIVVSQHGGRLPATADALLELPGIGKYTAHALLSSVHRQRVPLVDVNVQRVYSRLFHRMPYFNSMRPEDEIWEIAKRSLPPRNTYNWNQALMDLGASVCTARTPRCPECPLTTLCLSAGVMQMSPTRNGNTEPSRLGIPHRIYRGKIVEALRETNWLTARKIGEKILPGYTDADGEWLFRLLDGLREDGLVALRQGKDRHGCRVSLA